MTSDAFKEDNSRFSEPAKFLPVAFIVCNISAVWGIYMIYHCIPQLQHLDHATQQQGIIQTVVFNVLAGMLIYCYVVCALTHPGKIPDGTDWEAAPVDIGATDVLGNQHESKRSGDRRSCKWCAKYKPDRTHHCRVCRTCVLKMDHHCPWIYNCVGFRTYKHFLLLVLYSAIACHIVIWTMWDTLRAATYEGTPFMTMFVILFGETLGVLLAFLTTMFFCFHMWLASKAMTTIEFCEKSMKRSAYDPSVYDLGFYGNIKAVLGDNPWLWLLPLSLPSGDGLTFITDEAPLRLSTNRDLEVGRGTRTTKYDSTGEGKKPRRKRSEAGTGETLTDSSDVSGQESDANSAEPSASRMLMSAGATPSSNVARQSSGGSQERFF